MSLYLSHRRETVGYESYWRECEEPHSSLFAALTHNGTPVNAAVGILFNAATPGCPCLVLGYQALLKSVRGAAPNTPVAQAVPHEYVDVGKEEVTTACAVQGKARVVYVPHLGLSSPRAKRWSLGGIGSAGGGLRLPMPDAPEWPRLRSGYGAALGEKG